MLANVECSLLGQELTGPTSSPPSGLEKPNKEVTYVEESQIAA